MVPNPVVTDLAVKLSTQGMGMDLPGNFFLLEAFVLSSMMKFQCHISCFCVSVGVVYMYAFKYCLSKEVFYQNLQVP